MKSVNALLQDRQRVGERDVLMASHSEVLIGLKGGITFHQRLASVDTVATVISSLYSISQDDILWCVKRDTADFGNGFLTTESLEPVFYQALCTG